MTRPDEDFRSRDDNGEEQTPQARDIEAPEADAAEQSVPANPAEEPVPVRRGNEVGEYDAVEQARVVDLDDDYR